MPTPRPFTSYSGFYAEVFWRARDKPVVLNYDSPNLARRMRDRLYSFRSAALADLENSGRLALVLPLAKMSLAGSCLTIHYPDQKASNYAGCLPSSRISGKAR